MRATLSSNEEPQQFSDFLMTIGDGKYPVTEIPDKITLPKNIRTTDSLSDLIHTIYADIQTNYRNKQWLLERAILAPLNNTVNQINHEVISAFPGQELKYTAINKTLTTEEAVHFPTEFLDSLDIPGLPPHTLRLKKGCPVIILRSLNPPHITNGTRCTIFKTYPNVLEVTILNGPSSGENAFIPRIPLVPSDSDLPFKFQRLQFPMRPCFAMTINKAQGQTFQSIGIDLQEDVFSHGMLYVALSRVGSATGLTLHTPRCPTRNVVFHEVLQSTSNT
ncbi:ATP-dependent DNA helicase PIF6-like [Lineus longissimus]|uniref:ATP-dependent DNA helicase PIF6-like n=1 Tax=Lineus longissimus TaxID=88925 RepID=UPI00315C766A